MLSGMIRPGYIDRLHGSWSLRPSVGGKMFLANSNSVQEIVRKRVFLGNCGQESGIRGNGPFQGPERVVSRGRGTLKLKKGPFVVIANGKCGRLRMPFMKIQT
jgi:hypothetical protein